MVDLPTFGSPTIPQLRAMFRVFSFSSIGTWREVIVGSRAGVRRGLAERLQPTSNLAALLWGHHFGESVDLARMCPKDLPDQAAAGRGEVRNADSAILRTARPRDQSSP